MTRLLDVLVIESHPHTADAAVDQLRAAGHRIHRCHEPGGRPFPCVGIDSPSECPIDGPLDVALLVRRRVSPQPTPHEDGVSCALRAGVPLVEVGSATLDPYDPYVAVRADASDVVGACVAAVEVGHQPVVDDVMRRIQPVLERHGIDPDAVRCTLQTEWPGLRVVIDVDAAVGQGVEQALSVRALDAINAGTRSYEQIDVQVHSG